MISGKLDYMQDPPPADIMPEIKAKYSRPLRGAHRRVDLLHVHEHRGAPFDKHEVREAVNYGLDKPRLGAPVRRRGSPRAATSCRRACRATTRRSSRRMPVGRPERAAGPREGPADDQGRRRGGRQGHGLGQQRGSHRQGHRDYADQLNKIGLDAEPTDHRRRRLLRDDRQRARRTPQTGFANWFQDFPHPKNFMFLVDGKSIQPTNNQNYGNVEDPGDRQAGSPS